MADIIVPTLGESVTEATVATWFKKPGETVHIDEMLCELETDKVTVEVPSPVSGILTEITSDEGTTVGLNALLAIVDEQGSEKITKKELERNNKSAPTKNNQASNEEKEIIEETIHAPSARKIMNEQNIDPSKVIGSGRDGRITKEDVFSLNDDNNLDVGYIEYLPLK